MTIHHVWIVERFGCVETGRVWCVRRAAKQPAVREESFVFPAKDNTYIPVLQDPESEPNIEYVRIFGEIVALSDDRTRATVMTRKGLTMFFCAVTLNDDGSIGDFVPRMLNRYQRITPQKEKPETPETS